MTEVGEVVEVREVGEVFSENPYLRKTSEPFQASL